MKWVLSWCLCLLVINAVGQPGIAEMEKATQDLTSGFFSAVDLSFVIAGLFGITGAVKIYHNWQMGKREITADIAAWFFAALFMILSGVFLKALFGI